MLLLQDLDYYHHVNIDVICLDIELLFCNECLPRTPTEVDSFIGHNHPVTNVSIYPKRGKLQTKKLMLQGYNESRLKSYFRKFYGRYKDIVCDYKLSMANILNDLCHTLC
jgi:hypothetical protein